MFRRRYAWVWPAWGGRGSAVWCVLPSLGLRWSCTVGAAWQGWQGEARYGSPGWVSRLGRQGEAGSGEAMVWTVRRGRHATVGQGSARSVEQCLVWFVDAWPGRQGVARRVWNAEVGLARLAWEFRRGQKARIATVWEAKVRPVSRGEARVST